MQHPHLGYYVAHVIGGDGTIPGQMLGDGEIELTDELLVGAGGHRECYRHPQDRKLCIKITVSHDKRQSVRELTYYAILERRGIAWDMLPRYYGDISTNRGIGAVYDFIVDENGQPSSTLQRRLSDAAWMAQHWRELRRSLGELREYLLRYGIVTMNLHPENILCQMRTGGRIRLYIVDNVGTADFVPLAKYSRLFARLKMKRKWRRFKDLARRTWPGNSLVLRVFETADE